MGEATFLDELLRKKSTVMRVGKQTGKNVGPAIQKVDQQIRQVSTGNNGNPITGEGVTK